MKIDPTFVSSCAGELSCTNLTIVTYEEERTIVTDGHTINVVPVTQF